MNLVDRRLILANYGQAIPQFTGHGKIARRTLAVHFKGAIATPPSGQRTLDNDMKPFSALRELRIAAQDSNGVLRFRAGFAIRRIHTPVDIDADVRCAGEHKSKASITALLKRSQCRVKRSPCARVIRLCAGSTDGIGNFGRLFAIPILQTVKNPVG